MNAPISVTRGTGGDSAKEAFGIEEKGINRTAMSNNIKPVDMIVFIVFFFSSPTFE